jgi:hypothetical protein
MESRDDMLARHARELAELDSRWWEEWFTEDPCLKWESVPLEERRWRDWFKTILPTIIRKREKIGLTVAVRADGYGFISHGDLYSHIHTIIAGQLAGRTLAPGECVEI